MTVTNEVKPISSRKRPIFILGLGRSGTSVITSAISNGAGITGYAEGHFLPIVIPLMKDIDKFYSTKSSVLLNHERQMMSHINKDELKKEVLNSLKNIYESLHAPHEVWIDKSPGVDMITAIPYLLEIWPKSQFIFAKRRGIENIASRLRKFPHVSFEGHCMIWKSCMELWLTTRKNLESHLYIEVDQRQIALQPQEVASKIGEFLDFKPSQITGISDIFTNRRPQQTGSLETEKAVDINETGWSEEQINFFRDNCGSVSKKFGYDETSLYYIQ